ncbi:MAG: MFS transporter [Candidatus Methanomethylophilaceae archaeon]
MEVIRKRRDQMMLLLAIGLVVTMDGLDGSIVNVALPSIASDFNIDTGTSSWVTVTYLMMIAGLLLVFSRLADRGLIKKVLITGLALFMVFSLTCGLSTSYGILLVGRIFQGVGAAMMVACAPLLCVRYLPAGMLGMGMSIVTLGASLGFALGPALGGLITEYLSWQWIFFINVPIGIAGILLSMYVIPEDDGYSKTHFDLTGAMLMFVAIVSGVFTLERFSHAGMNDIPIIVSTIVCIAAFVSFIAWESRCDAPVLNLRIFRRWRFGSVFMAFLLINIVYMGLLYLLPFYLTLEMGLDSAESGMYLFIPPTITLLICTQVGRRSDLVGRRWFSVSACVALAVLSLIYAIIDPGRGVVPLAVALVLMGLVWGLGGGPAASRIVENAGDEERGTGSALMVVSGYLGGGVGTTLFSAFFLIVTGSGDTPFSEMNQSMFMTGFHATMIMGTVLAVIAVILSAVVKDDKKLF